MTGNFAEACRGSGGTRGCRVLIVALAWALLAGCAVHGSVVVDPAPPVVVQPPPRGYHAPPSVPKGHLPPPGKCRVWFPDRAPGQQPPPGDCEELQYRVPHGAYLIRG
ncbi:MAG: hypothetical protein WC713_03790 [Candidatus Methylomirabilota bacterium]